MEQKPDKRLDAPAEANREKHINFLEAEEQAYNESDAGNDRTGKTDEDRRRQEEWQKGLREGKEAREANG